MLSLLFKPSQHEKYLGEQVSLTLRMAVNNRRKYKGVITRIEGEMLVLVVQGRKTADLLDGCDSHWS
jgi:ribosome maturation factor RimP